MRHRHGGNQRKPTTTENEHKCSISVVGEGGRRRSPTPPKIKTRTLVFKGCSPCVRATAVGQNTVLAGDLKVFRLLGNTNLNMIHT